MKDDFDQFLRDVFPLFYRMNITYVDVGAYDGGVFKALLEAGIRVGEAHLIEPNPESYELLKTNVAELVEGRAVHTYNLALSDKSGKLSFKAARKMTQVIEGRPVQSDGSGVFSVSAKTIDQMAHLIREGRISLLKIDVEGHEDKVLAGAETLLSGHKIDVVYIEAGMDPAGKQQCYYRDIDDIMLRHGYRPFKIYEQMHEWMDDSPFLRRVNIAYLSPRFAESRPLKLLHETIKLREEKDDLKGKLQVEREQSREYREAMARLKEDAQALARAAEEALAEQAKLKVSLVNAECRAADVERLKAELETTRATAQGDVIHIRKKLEAARSDLARMEVSHAEWERRAADAERLKAEFEAPLLAARDESLRLGRELDSVRAERDRVDELSAGAERRASELTTDKERLREEIVGLKANLTEVRATANQDCRQLRQQMMRDRKIAAQLRAELESATRASGEQATHLRLELAERERLNAEIAAERDTLQNDAAAEIGCLEGKLARAAQAQGKIAAELEAVKSQLRESVERNKVEANHHDEQVSRLSADIDVRDRIIATLKDEAATALSARQAELDNQQATLDRMTADLHQAEAKIDRLAAEIASNEATINRLRELEVTRASEASDRDKPNANSVREINELKQAQAERARAVELLLAEKLRLNGEVRRLTRELAALQRTSLGRAYARLTSMRQWVGRNARFLYPRSSDSYISKVPSAPREASPAGSPPVVSVAAPHAAPVVPSAQDKNSAAAVRGDSNGLATPVLKTRAPTEERAATQTPKAPAPPAKPPSVKTAPSGLASHSARELEDKLWGGFSGRAFAELEALEVSESASARERSQAAWALACWHAAENAQDRAEVLLRNDRLRALGKVTRPRLLLEVYSLARLGRGAEARQLLEPELKQSPDDPHLLLATANTFLGTQNDAERLAWINRVYEQAGLAVLTPWDATRPLSATNLSASAPPPHEAAQKVSIILPAYNAEHTLDFTLRGITAQSWRNLEIIVVDDCSTDGTRSVMERLATQDDRIHLVYQPVNQGSYSARNRGLNIATGDFITVHDAGDWSHPQKIERQAVHLIENASVIANHSNWARCLDDLMFVGKFRRKDKIVEWNPSSFMFRRELLELVGGWDRVRISADAEFIRRTRRCAPDRQVCSIPDRSPLSFGISAKESLTKNTATHGRTIHYGIRREYHEAANHWHHTSRCGDLWIERYPSAERPFPAPSFIAPERQGLISCDILIVGDFESGPDLRSLTSTIRRERCRLDMIGLFNWRRYMRDVNAPLAAVVRDLAADGIIRIVAPGEAVRTHTLLVTDPEVLENEIDLQPSIDFHQLLLVGAVERPTVAQKTVERRFGATGVWMSADEAWARAVPRSAVKAAQ